MAATGRDKIKNIPHIILCLCCVFGICQTTAAQDKDSITIELNKTSFLPGDSINIDVALYDYKKVAKTATIQLWVENIETGRKWKYRYPLINGQLSARLIVDSTLSPGTYAFNFLLHKTFFSINGNVQNAGKKDAALNYLMISKSRQTMMDVLPLTSEHSFSIKNLLFQDSAFIIFSKPGQKNNELLVNINTPLDSSFTPAAVCTYFITVAAPQGMGKPQVDTAKYLFALTDTKYKILMPEVVVTAKSAKRLENFIDENVTGVFTSDEGITLDGISSDEMANAPDLYIYLTTKVAGLRIERDNESGMQSFKWRGQATDLFINEIRLDRDMPLAINPSDIAMIKIFRPGTSLLSDASGGGAIAIYTKTGDYNQATNRNYSFYIVGYTAAESFWK